MLGSVALLGPPMVALWVFSVADVLATSHAQVRRRSKTRWLVLTSFLPLVGSVAWVVAGRPTRRSRSGPAGEAHPVAFGDSDLRRLIAAMSPPDAHSTEDFRRRCRERAQEQRRRYADRQRATRPANGATGPAGAAD